MLTRLLVHLREWAGVLALVLVLTGGVAYAANTVFSSDIVDGQVFSADVRNDTRSDGGLVAADLRSNSVGSSEVTNNSLTGADLGVRVRGARQPASGPARLCGTGADFDECTSLLFTVPRPQRLLLIGSGDWVGIKSGQGNSGECLFQVGGGLSLGQRVFGEVNTLPSNPFNFAMNSVTPVLDAGVYDIGIVCRNTNPSGAVTVMNTEVSVVALGDG